ncbi:MAG: hypothetical protein J1F32_00040 [Erysipelotrichales bacterium]|nr:hypothetical protein [Erysipelotrichales bacterium]
MNIEQKELVIIVSDAISEFNLRERYLLDRNLSERCICSKFASYLERALIGTKYSGYDVDVEYNRGMNGNEYAKKRLFGKNAIVDLIVHKRGYDYENSRFHNLICIEMKKRGGQRNLCYDKNRLSTMTDFSCGFNYQIGFMLIARKSGIVIDKIFPNERDGDY